MRKITEIIVHCSASRQGATASEIAAYHTRPVAEGGKGWSVAGYHWVVEADGLCVAVVPESVVANGCKGHNVGAVHVCWVGGVDVSRPGLPAVDNRTPQQRESLRRVVEGLRRRYPGAKVYGHRDFAAKACPCFDARQEYGSD